MGKALKIAEIDEAGQLDLALDLLALARAFDTAVEEEHGVFGIGIAGILARLPGDIAFLVALPEVSAGRAVVLGFELPLAVVALVTSQRCNVLGHVFLHFAQLKQRSCMAGTSAALAKSGCASGVPFAGNRLQGAKRPKMGGSRCEARRGRSPKPELSAGCAGATGSSGSMEASFLGLPDDLEFIGGFEFCSFAEGVAACEEGMFEVHECRSRFRRGFGLPEEAREDDFENVSGLGVDAIEKVFEEFEVFAVEVSGHGCSRFLCRFRGPFNTRDIAPAALLSGWMGSRCAVFTVICVRIIAQAHAMAGVPSIIVDTAIYKVPCSLLSSNMLRKDRLHISDRSACAGLACLGPPEAGS